MKLVVLKSVPSHHVQGNGNGNGPQGAGQLLRSVLVARAAWLVGVCGTELPPPLWAAAFAALTSHISDADLVLALTAVSAAMSLCTFLLERQHVRPPCPTLANIEASTSYRPVYD